MRGRKQIPSLSCGLPGFVVMLLDVALGEELV